jgi:mannose-6-phosphate isomerase-like protein (cupin superfamily)
MNNTKRRSFLTGVAAVPFALLAQTKPTSTQAPPIRVAAGSDRFGEHHTIGVSLTDYKVASTDARGGLFVMEHTSKKKGGPPQHLHHNEDEWFYVVAGEYTMVIGAERFQLKAGDSILGPREIPHVWAFTGEGTGKMLIAFAPANKMEAFFASFKPRGGAYSNWDDPQDKARHRAFDMELLGPPLPV